MKKTVYKPWTENTCPLKVGDVLWDPLNKREVMVTVRMHSENKDDPQANLIVLGDCPYSGQELLDFGLECWDNYPDKTTSFKCCEAHLVEEDHWISDYLYWTNQLPLADLPDTGKAIHDFKTAIIEQKKVSLVLQLGYTLKDMIEKDWEEPEPEWFTYIDTAILRYVKDKEEGHVEN